MSACEYGIWLHEYQRQPWDGGVLDLRMHQAQDPDAALFASIQSMGD